MTTKLFVCLGTRPEAIKLAPLILAARARAEFEVRVCNTAQHREMTDGVLSLFGIAPDFDLDLMRPGQTIGGVTAGVLAGMAPLLLQEKPDWMIVQGDTTTTFASAMAAFYAQIRVAHVEAGLRTQDIYSPFPEEMNRRLVGQLASLHFPPTPTSADNLRREGVAENLIFTTGNTGIDALKLIASRLLEDAGLAATAEADLVAAGIPATALEDGAHVVLLTCHRRESFGAGLASIFGAVADLAMAFPERLFVFPAHPNPAVRAAVSEFLSPLGLSNLHVVEPLQYLPFIRLMLAAELIITDSGGIQEEAPSLGRRVMVVRDTTERAEGLASGLVRMSGMRRDAIVTDAGDALLGRWHAKGSTDVYGDGQASGRILDAISAGSGN